MVIVSGTSGKVMSLIYRNGHVKRLACISSRSYNFPQQKKDNYYAAGDIRNIFSRFYSASTDTKRATGDNRAGPEESSTPIGRNHSSYCSELVRKHEYESFLCALLLKGSDIRSFVFGVRSFNVEIALIRDHVSQKDIGIGRLAFWRDAVNKIFQNRSIEHGTTVDTPRHPVALELSRVLKNKHVSKKWFVNLMDARERIMNDVAFNDLHDLEAYCDKSVSPILYLGFEALGIKNLDADHACSHLGKAIGLANFIRSIPYNAQRRRVLIPQELLAKHKLSQENFIRFTKKENIADAVYDIASQAHAHYKHALDLKPSIPKEGLPLTIIGTPTDIYLQRLQNSQFNPYDVSLSRRYSLLPVHLYWRRFTNRYY